MKKIISIFTVFFLFLQFVSAQKSDTLISSLPQKGYDYYWHKRKINNTAGFVCLSTGILFAGLGVQQGILSTLDAHSGEADGTAFFVAGGAAIVGSLIFFTAAHKNKKMALALKNESLNINNRTIYKSGYAAIALTIHL